MNQMGSIGAFSGGPHRPRQRPGAPSHQVARRDAAISRDPGAPTSIAFKWKCRGPKRRECNHGRRGLRSACEEKMAEDADQQRAFVWKGSLDIFQVCEIRDQLLQASREGRPIVLEAKSVDRLDTAFIQMLVAFFAHVRSIGVEARWKTIPDSISHAAQQLGLAEHIALARGDVGGPSRGRGWSEGQPCPKAGGINGEDPDRR